MFMFLQPIRVFYMLTDYPTSISGEIDLVSSIPLQAAAGLLYWYVHTGTQARCPTRNTAVCLVVMGINLNTLTSVSTIFPRTKSEEKSGFGRFVAMWESTSRYCWENMCQLRWSYWPGSSPHQRPLIQANHTGIYQYQAYTRYSISDPKIKILICLWASSVP